MWKSEISNVMYSPKYLLCNRRFLVNATLGSALSSPLESPDILQRFLPVSDIGPATTSMASIKLSADSINTKSQQVRLQTFQSNSSVNYCKPALATTSFIEMESSTQNSLSNLESAASLRSIQSDCASNSISGDTRASANLKLNTIFEHPTSTGKIPVPQTPILSSRNPRNIRTNSNDRSTTLLEFSLSSVGRSFIDESAANPDVGKVQATDSLKTPDTPEPNISPSTSSFASKSCFSETFSNDFIKPSTPSVIVSPLEEQPPKYASSTTTNNTNGGSWDLLELDLDFHHVNFDPSFGGDVEENVFFGDDPLGILPIKPTEPDSHDL